MKNGNQNYSGIPKNRKAFLIFFYNDHDVTKGELTDKAWVTTKVEQSVCGP